MLLYSCELMRTKPKGEQNMKAAVKNEIIKKLNEFLAQYGATIEFNKPSSTYLPSGTEAGFLTIEKIVVIKQTNKYEIVAHEIAHAVQYHRRGETACGSSYIKIADRKRVNLIIDEFQKIEEEMIKTLSKLGIEEIWNRANNTTYRTGYVHPKRVELNKSC